jgi:hypothetical protein
VDKEEFVYSVNGLRAFQYAGKALYPRRTEAGQNRQCRQNAGFCTFAAVDMQALFHRRVLSVRSCRVGRTLRVAVVLSADPLHDLDDMQPRCRLAAAMAAFLHSCRQINACNQVAVAIDAAVRVVRSVVVLVNLRVNIKIVVVVNVARNVDKPVFLHRVNGLHRMEGLAQRMCVAWTETGQKKFVREFRRFRTYAPVDMHGLIHTGDLTARSVIDKCCRQGDFPASTRLPACSAWVLRALTAKRIVNMCRNGKVPSPLGRSQVYPQMHVYRIVVVVNGMPLLWISLDSSTASKAYGAYKGVVCSCMCSLEKLDNISRRGDSLRFPHSVPVDMQMLIHSRQTGLFHSSPSFATRRPAISSRHTMVGSHVGYV